MSNSDYIPQCFEGGISAMGAALLCEARGFPALCAGAPRARVARSLILYTVSQTNKRENAGVR